ncbi:MAG: hypothetical protein GY862_07115, partial [Gammaproteobacteria bacterium]|nr:hypothetical protein [Gammaproteobacteria bacterium]
MFEEEQIAETLFECSSMRTPEIRQAVINRLSFAGHISENSQAKAHIFAIVANCAKQARGFDTLLD